MTVPFAKKATRDLQKEQPFHISCIVIGCSKGRSPLEICGPSAVRPRRLGWKVPGFLKESLNECNE